MLLRQLRTRFGGHVDIAVERRLEAASPEQLALWGERVLSAASLTELLGDRGSPTAVAIAQRSGCGW